mgnify:CR=1 FL=1
MESFKELFQMVKDYTRQYVIDSKELSELAYQLWIKSLEPVSFDGNTAVLYIKAEFMKKIVEEKYLDLLTKAFEAVVGFPVKIEILCETSEKGDKKEISPASIQTSSPSPVLPSYSQEEIDMNSQGGEYEYTFSTFIVGSSNKFAQAACRAVAQNPANAYNPLFIYGGSGLGKTHLLYAIAGEIKESRPKTNVIYVKGEEFTNELIAAIGAESTKEFHDKYRQADVLLVDDIQFIGGKESTQEEFFHTFNHLHTSGKQIIISSDKPPRDIETLEARLRTRFEWGLIADISAPNYETRMAILQKKIELDHLEKYNIPHDVLDYIATNIKTNIRELEGSLNKLIALYKLNSYQDPIDINLATRALKDIISSKNNRVVTPELILDIVADHFNISVADLKSNKRNAEIAIPRQIAMYFIRSMTDTSLKSIGIILGGKDHSTIKYGADKIAIEIKEDETLANTINIIKKKINPA